MPKNLWRYAYMELPEYRALDRSELSGLKASVEKHVIPKLQELQRRKRRGAARVRQVPLD